MDVMEADYGRNLLVSIEVMELWELLSFFHPPTLTLLYFFIFFYIYIESTDRV